MRSHSAGKLEDAERHYRAILAKDSSHAESFHRLGIIATQVGQHDIAVALIARAIEIMPHAAVFHANLGVAHRNRGAFEDAIASFRRAVAINPKYAAAYLNMAHSLVNAGRGEHAIASFRKAIRFGADDAEAHFSLAVTLHSHQQQREALPHYRAAIARRPDSAEAYSNLGGALRDCGLLEEAIAACRQAVELNPKLTQAYVNLGNALLDHGNISEATVNYRKATDLAPEHAVARNLLGNALHEQTRVGEAVEHFRNAISRDPVYAQAYRNLGNALLDQGDLDEAIAALRTARDIEPASLNTHSDLIMALHYSPRYSSADILKEARRFAVHVEAARPPSAFRLDNAPRPLRIGYVSADFRTHPVGYYLARVLESHDRDHFHVTCYSNTSSEDAMTDRLRKSAGVWRSIAGRSDAEAADIIRADGIDVLVDLSGHTGGNRLSLFAMRAAPVQATWLGFFGTTGLSSIDYIIGDDFVAPEGDEPFFSESIWRVPGCYLCYSPPGGIETAPPPRFATGHVTFGCFNKTSKITPDVVAAWATILREMSDARLFLKAKSLDDDVCKTALRAQFAAHGIDAGRLLLEGHSPPREALAAYNRVDIALDPFPFGGCATTTDALWMGVPLVALQGERWSGRMSHSILTAIGKAEWVAQDMDGYIDIACRLARTLTNEGRSALRTQVEQSPFCDGPGFTLKLEAAYRGMWKRATSQP